MLHLYRRYGGAKQVLTASHIQSRILNVRFPSVRESLKKGDPVTHTISHWGEISFFLILRVARSHPVEITSQHDFLNSIDYCPMRYSGSPYLEILLREGNLIIRIRSRLYMVFSCRTFSFPSHYVILTLPTFIEIRQTFW